MSPVIDHYLAVPGLDTQLDYIWLRDHCRCPKCYNHATNQRRLAIRDIPLDIIADSSKVNGDQLTVTCECRLYLVSYQLASNRPHLTHYCQSLK